MSTTMNRPSMRPASEVLDPKFLAQLRSRDYEHEPDFFEKLVDMFVTQASQRIESMRDAYTKSQLKKVALEAHALKGSCGYFRASRMVAICDELESKAMKRDVTGMRPLVDKISNEFLAVSEVLGMTAAKA